VTGRDEPSGPPEPRRSGRRRDPLERIQVGGGRPEPLQATGRRRSRGAGLDRIRPRDEGARRRKPSAPEPLTGGDLDDPDPLGKLSLFSSPDQRAPVLGTFIVECSACRRETPVHVADLVRAGIPSIHLPLVKRYPSLMRCPACGRRTWVRVRWRL
jgi:hypothetical protein